MSRFRVVFTNPTILPEGVEILKQEADVFWSEGPDEASIIRCVREHKAQAIFTRVELITRTIFQSCPSLKVVQEHGIGCDNIDLSAAAEHGVMVLNIPGGTAVAVSEHTVMMILALAQSLLPQDRCVRDGKPGCVATPVPLEGKRLFLIGFGNIGRKVAQKMAGIGMTVGAYDQYITQDAMAAAGVTKIESLEEGLRWADVVSLHAPLNEETKHMIGAPQLAWMKRSALLVNCSRGGLVDETALYHVLREGNLAGAGIDVFAREPIVAEDTPLLSLPNVIASPHCAGASLEGRARPAILGAQGILSALRGESPGASLVNRAQLRALGTLPV
ncbi:MAG: hydroxyacid dehydrogenase [Lawsonibacter sp.]|nr:hydroxyacid dehydrogenase [Lawsonibacter sp.]